MSCVTCDTAPAPCSCDASQTCVQTARNCTACPINVCRESLSFSGSGSGLGATIGGSVGGVLGGMTLLAVGWFLWRKGVFDKLVGAEGKKLKAAAAAEAAKRERRATRRAEKATRAVDEGGGGAGAEAVEMGEATGRSRGVNEQRVSKRQSAHLMDVFEEEGVAAAGGTDAVNVGEVRGGSTVKSGDLAGLTQDGIIGKDDNPFGDHHSLTPSGRQPSPSCRDSDFSFRSSRSTNIIPIAYIPPASKSLSISDAADRDAYGNTTAPARECRSSVVQLGLEVLDPSPPLPTPPLSATGKPIRPPRAPDLDLKLPASPPAIATSGSSPGVGAGGRPKSVFLGQSPKEIPSAGADSRFSASTVNTLQLSQAADSMNWSSAPPLPTSQHSLGAGDGMPIMSRLSLPPSENGESTGEDERLSVISDASTSRDSHLSHLSGIVDPALIVTPVTLVRTASGRQQAVQRVAIAGQEKARVVRIPGSAVSATSGWLSPAPTVTSSGMSGTASFPPTPAIATAPVENYNPFSDAAAVPASPSAKDAQPEIGLDDSGLSTHATVEISLQSPGMGECAPAASAFPSTANPYTANGTERKGQGELQRMQAEAARSQSTMSRRTMDSLRTAEESDRTVSISSDESFLDGVQFASVMTVPTGSRPPHQNVGHVPIAPMFPMPPPPKYLSSRAGLETGGGEGCEVGVGRPSSAVSSASTQLPFVTSPTTEGGVSSFLDWESASSNPLPGPFKPFAGQKPPPLVSSSNRSENSHALSVTSSARFSSASAVSSAASVRTGYGSVLEGIPFNIGIGGLGSPASERGSLLSDVGMIDGPVCGGRTMTRPTSSATSSSRMTSRVFSVASSIDSLPNALFSEAFPGPRPGVGEEQPPPLPDEDKATVADKLTAAAASSVMPVPAQDKESGTGKETKPEEMGQEATDRDSTTSLLLSAELARSFVNE